MSDGGQRGRYLGLDALRGVAAVLIVIRHCGGLWAPVAFEKSYLAVDLFFALSGFVMAEAYGRRLDAGLSTWSLMRIRLARLYPLYALGLAIGLPWGLAVAGAQHDWGRFAAMLGFNALLLPAPVPFAPLGGRVGLCMIDIAAWSLYFELLANAAMALLWRRLSLARLLAAAGAFGAALAWLSLRLGGLDHGFYWGVDELATGLARVGFSFTVGLALQRAPRLRLRLGPWGLGLALALEAWILCGAPPAGWAAAYDLLACFAVIPLTLALAAACEPPAGRFQALAQALGSASYGVYIIHATLTLAALWVLRRGGLDLEAYAPYSGAAWTALLVLGALWLDRAYDRPFRNWLTRRLAG